MGLFNQSGVHRTIFPSLNVWEMRVELRLLYKDKKKGDP